eukprot:scaffold222153_cov47-Attheya_sp.AAC.1
MKKSTATVATKSADEPIKEKKDPPLPPESEKNNMKKSTATVPTKSAYEPSMNKDPPTLSPPK